MLQTKFDREVDGRRWIADIEALPGVMAYGSTQAEARTAAAKLALLVIADRLERGAGTPADALALGFRVMADQLEGEEPGPANMDRFSAGGATAWPAAIKAGQIRSVLVQRANWALPTATRILRFRPALGNEVSGGVGRPDRAAPLRLCIRFSGH
jgi:predicted RNase H-like HicB family nuclease